MKKLLVVFWCLAVLGCAPYKLQSVFNQADIDIYKKKGDGSIAGQAFLKTRGGEVRFGAGNTVSLIPATQYVKDMLAAIEDHAHYVDPRSIDQRWDDYSLTTQADGTGNFEFTDLPQGDYYLKCDITWEVPNPLLVPLMRTTGGEVSKVVTLGAGQKLKVMLTEQYE